MSPDPVPYDALVIGGGPAGATAALSMVRSGLSVRLVERTPHPRFHVGESFLPRNMTLLRDLGLEPALQALTHVPKHGAEFVAGDGSAGYLFAFEEALCNPEPAAFNIERAPFDAMILDAARTAGTEVTEGVAVREIPVLEDGKVEAVLDTGERVAARYLIDASGQATVLGKHLGIRKVLPQHRKVAYFNHFQNVWRHPGIAGGYITIVMCDQGDAATFVDPIFSTGVCLGMMSAVRAADGIRSLRGGAEPRRIRRDYIRFVQKSSEPFFGLVDAYYQPSFRDLFLSGQGPLQVHRAVLAVLAGNVFPRPPFPLRWRLRLMHLITRIQRFMPLAPRRPRFSLLAESADPPETSEPASLPSAG